MLNFAIAVQDAGRTNLFALAQYRLKRLIELGYGNERVYFHLGMLAMTTKQLDQAEKWFREAIKRESNFQSANFNLALLLCNQKRPLEALPFLEKLSNNGKEFPNHIKGLTLLCDILINHAGDPERAERCYKYLIQLEPGNPIARHNLCVVYVEQRLLDKAEHCLNDLASIVPRADYIDRHLKIVRMRILKMRQATSRDIPLS